LPVERRVYFDNVATTPLLPEVLDAMLPYFRDLYGNAQSLHSWGDAARTGVENAREQVAGLIGAKAEEIVFTSCGTESNNLAVKGLAQGSSAKGKHIIVSAVEHFSVLHAARTLQKAGYDLTIVPVDGNGLVDPDEVSGHIRKDTVLVSIMHANGEIGTIEPIAEIGRRTREAGVIFHTDAVASSGNIPVNVAELGVDALSLAGNQFYGPKGSGALWVRKGIRLLPMMDGGIQEGGRRPGTENVPAIIGLGHACEIAASGMEDRSRKWSVLRDSLIKGVLAGVEHSVLTGHPSKRLPHHASFCVEFIEGESMLMLLDMQGIACSSGSACTSRALKASHVLIAIGLSHELAQGSLVFSLGRNAAAEDISYVSEKLPPIVSRLRQMSPLYAKFMRQKE
jgi:cysteine desulfurase